MTRLTIILILTLCSLSGCIPEKQQTAASKVATLWGAEIHTISHVEYKDDLNRTHNALLLKFGQLPSANSSYSHDEITSSCAMNFIQELSKEDYEDFEQIKIEIETNSSKYEKVYDIEQLNKTIALFKKTIPRFFKSIYNKDSIDIKNLLDENTITSSSINKIMQIKNRIDTSLGKLSDVTVTGFKYGLTKETNDSILIAWVQATANGQKVMPFEFFFYQRTGKIFYIGINNL